jgi:hypothetical protein
MGHEPGDTLFGLYHGTPLTERGWAHGNALPDRIVLYQRPLEAECEDEDELFEEVCLTLIHEAGHYFGSVRGKRSTRPRRSGGTAPRIRRMNRAGIAREGAQAIRPALPGACLGT